MLQLILLPCLLTVIKGAPSEGSSKEFEFLQSANAVPRMGKREPSPVYSPSFTSGFLAPVFPKLMNQRTRKREDGPKPIDTMAGYRPSWQFGKRSPWTGAWANILWRPDIAKDQQGTIFSSCIFLLYAVASLVFQSLQCILLEDLTHFNLTGSAY